MTVRDLIDTLVKFEENKEIVFYNLENYELQGRELEKILDVDGHIEITIQEIGHQK